jgi:predicted Zn-ribbon and HTH transcriptional regulator
MSISMEPFASVGHYATYDPFASASHRVAVFQLQCRNCGFEPEEVVSAPRFCPKCHSTAWERFARPGGILENADRS